MTIDITKCSNLYTIFDLSTLLIFIKVRIKIITNTSRNLKNNCEIYSLKNINKLINLKSIKLKMTSNPTDEVYQLIHGVKVRKIVGSLNISTEVNKTNTFSNHHFLKYFLFLDNKISQEYNFKWKLEDS